MNAAGYRQIKINLSEELCEHLEHLQQRIIASTVGEEAIDNGLVPNFTGEMLLDHIIKIGFHALYYEDSEIIYDEESKAWVVSKS